MEEISPVNDSGAKPSLQKYEPVNCSPLLSSILTPFQ